MTTRNTATKLSTADRIAAARKAAREAAFLAGRTVATVEASKAKAA